MKHLIRKHIVSSELSYALGLFFLALGVAFMARADLGVSMLVAPAHAIHTFIEHTVKTVHITLGAVEFAVQVILLAIMSLLLHKFKIEYLWAFVTTLIYGVILDTVMIAVSMIPSDHIGIRIILFAFGGFCMSLGVALMFRTYIAPEIYELLVIELSDKFHLDIHRFKTWFDCGCCLVAIALEFIFFGLWTFEAVKIGTVLFALVNGTLISVCGKFLDTHFSFKRSIKNHKKDIDKK